MTAVLLAALIVLANWALSAQLKELLGAGEGWWRLLLYYLLVIVSVAATVVVGYFAFSAAGMVVAAPFNDVLSARAERVSRGGARELPAGGSASGEGFFAGAIRAVSDALRLATVMLAVQLLVLPLLLIPIAGAIVNLTVTSYLNGVDYLDIVLSRHGFTHAEKKAILRASRARTLGLGTGLTLSMLFPLTTLLVLPLGVVGATLVYLDLERKGRLARGGAG